MLVATALERAIYIHRSYLHLQNLDGQKEAEEKFVCLKQAPAYIHV